MVIQHIGFAEYQEVFSSSVPGPHEPDSRLLFKTALFALFYLFYLLRLSAVVTPLLGGVLFTRWGVLFACKASPELRALLLRRLKNSRIGLLLLPVRDP